jgi:hypothetical protein
MGSAANGVGLGDRISADIRVSRGRRMDVAISVRRNVARSRVDRPRVQMTGASIAMG